MKQQGPNSSFQMQKAAVTGLRAKTFLCKPSILKALCSNHTEHFSLSSSLCQNVECSIFGLRHKILTHILQRGLCPISVRTLMEDKDSGGFGNRIFGFSEKLLVIIRCTEPFLSSWSGTCLQAGHQVA